MKTQHHSCTMKDREIERKKRAVIIRLRGKAKIKKKSNDRQINVHERKKKRFKLVLMHMIGEGIID